ncbi:hypothetical protein AQS8620_03026 [Aquimixticola soesokkakensis]|uniref:Mth938-like domain-containing protein n=1 Tax=Aquimixticola soesokkakensis TaxID=1519096 RepID=A0A1Y5TML0_9RHOB|nr:Mth938-like domain-containing protein [Aquimixticola soesokkakensis]SLN65490.1 hypothetical protein AQS8620_03026 [Aquimixticola soesokkakensis]
MQFNEMTFDSAQPVDGYGAGFFRIAGQVVEGPVIVTASGVTSWGGLNDAQALVSLAGEIDVLFIGTGQSIAPLPRALRAALEAAGIGVDMMASPTACRTYNVLASEGRRVAAALLPV